MVELLQEKSSFSPALAASYLSQEYSGVQHYVNEFSCKTSANHPTTTMLDSWFEGFGHQAWCQIQNLTKHLPLGLFQGEGATLKPLFHASQSFYDYAVMDINI